MIFLNHKKIEISKISVICESLKHFFSADVGVDGPVEEDENNEENREDCSRPAINRLCLLDVTIDKGLCVFEGLVATAHLRRV